MLLFQIIIGVSLQLLLLYTDIMIHSHSLEMCNNNIQHLPFLINSEGKYLTYNHFVFLMRLYDIRHRLRDLHEKILLSTSLPIAINDTLERLTLNGYYSIHYNFNCKAELFEQTWNRWNCQSLFNSQLTQCNHIDSRNEMVVARVQEAKEIVEKSNVRKLADRIEKWLLRLSKQTKFIKTGEMHFHPWRTINLVLIMCLLKSGIINEYETPGEWWWLKKLDFFVCFLERVTQRNRLMDS